MAIDSVIHTNRYSIDRVLNAGVPLLLVFTTEARPLSPNATAALDELAARFAGKLLIARINAAEEPDLPARFQVRELPAAVVIRNGKPEATLVGAPRPNDLRASALRDWAEYLVQGGPRPAINRATLSATAGPPDAHARPGTATDGGGPRVLSDANFDRALAGALPLLVDFWAPWCGPCRMVAPSVERLAQEYAGRAVVAKMNVDENPQTQQRYRILSIPTLLIFKHGQVADQIVGAQPYAVLQQRLARQVGA